MFSATGLVPDLLQLNIIGEAKLICSMRFSAKKTAFDGRLEFGVRGGQFMAGGHHHWQKSLRLGIAALLRPRIIPLFLNQR